MNHFFHNMFIRVQYAFRLLSLMLFTVGFFFFIILLIRFFIFSPGRINGKSMEPTYQDNDLFFVKKSTYLFVKPQRYDIVQIVDPKDGKLVIKRIIGLPGETVVIKRGGVYIAAADIPVEDAAPLDETLYFDRPQYTTTPEQTKPEAFVLGEYDYFVLGDNRDGSIDSRHYGAIHRRHIVGLVDSPRKDIHNIQ